MHSLQGMTFNFRTDVAFVLETSWPRFLCVLANDRLSAARYCRVFHPQNVDTQTFKDDCLDLTIFFIEVLRHNCGSSAPDCPWAIYVPSLSLSLPPPTLAAGAWPGVCCTPTATPQFGSTQPMGGLPLGVTRSQWCCRPCAAVAAHEVRARCQRGEGCA